MEKQHNNGMEMERAEGKAVITNTRKDRVKCCELVLRLLALLLTLVAAVIVGVDKQTEVVPIVLSSALSPLDVPVSAKWHYMSAFVYFVVTNAVACSYAAFSLIGTLTNRNSNNNNKGIGLVIIICDILMVALLFSGNGAAAAVGILGYKGNSHVLWNKVCNVFDRFCQHIAIGIALSLLGSLTYVGLLIVSIMDLHKRSK